MDRFPQRRDRVGPGLARDPRRPALVVTGTIKRDEYNGGNAAEMHVEDAALA